MTSTNSSQISKEIRKELLEMAEKRARDGEDIRPGTAVFWQITGRHLVRVSELLVAIHEEVREEQKANSVTDETRSCLTCGGVVRKKHVRGRWPLYCTDCR